MTSKRITDHFGVLEYLKSLNARDQKSFINGASIELLKTISEICLNLIKGTIDISKDNINKLRKYKKQILTLSEKKHSAKKRRKVCSQKGGFLPTLIGLTLPGIITAIISATRKK